MNIDGYLQIRTTHKLHEKNAQYQGYITNIGSAIVHGIYKGP